jgi:hypothetical protein
MSAIGDAMAVGFQPGAVLLFDKSGAGSSSAWNSLNSQVYACRQSPSKKVEFEEKDRKSASTGRAPRLSARSLFNQNRVKKVGLRPFYGRILGLTP